MPDVMMKLGDYAFSVDTAAYQQFQRSTQYRWSSQQRVGRHDALQFVGFDADSITLTGKIYPEYRSGPNQIRDMREAGQKGEPMMLVDGNGFVHGRWVVLGIDEQSDTFALGGTPRRQSFTLNMRYYGDGELSDQGG